MTMHRSLATSGPEKLAEENAELKRRINSLERRAAYTQQRAYSEHAEMVEITLGDGTSADVADYTRPGLVNSISAPEPASLVSTYAEFTVVRGATVDKDILMFVFANGTWFTTGVRITTGTVGTRYAFAPGFATAFNAVAGVGSPVVQSIEPGDYEMELAFGVDPGNVIVPQIDQIQFWTTVL